MRILKLFLVMVAVVKIVCAHVVWWRGVFKRFKRMIAGKISKYKLC